MVAKNNYHKIIKGLNKSEKDSMIGPTGSFPKGKIDEDDKGGLAVAISTNREKGIIKIEFGTYLTWFALRADEARHLAKELLERADILEK
jgi:hypothetical protein